MHIPHTKFTYLPGQKQINKSGACEWNRASVGNLLERGAVTVWRSKDQPSQPLSDSYLGPYQLQPRCSRLKAVQSGMTWSAFSGKLFSSPSGYLDQSSLLLSPQDLQMVIKLLRPCLGEQVHF